MQRRIVRCGGVGVFRICGGSSSRNFCARRISYQAQGRYRQLRPGSCYFCFFSLGV